MYWYPFEIQLINGSFYGTVLGIFFCRVYVKHVKAKNYFYSALVKSNYYFHHHLLLRYLYLPKWSKKNLVIYGLILGAMLTVYLPSCNGCFLGTKEFKR
jgi:hypothetical protein